MSEASSKRKMLFVGGLDDKVNEEVLHAAFIPFGNIKEVHIPRDFKKNAHKGFGFVDFEDAEDATAAIENMDGAEVYGKVLKVNIAKPGNKNIPHGKSLWSAEEWIESNLAEADEGVNTESGDADNQ